MPAPIPIIPISQLPKIGTPGAPAAPTLSDLLEMSTAISPGSYSVSIGDVLSAQPPQPPFLTPLQQSFDEQVDGTIRLPLGPKMFKIDEINGTTMFQVSNVNIEMYSPATNRIEIHGGVNTGDFYTQIALADRRHPAPAGLSTGIQLYGMRDAPATQVTLWNLQTDRLSSFNGAERTHVRTSTYREGATRPLTFYNAIQDQYAFEVPVGLNSLTTAEIASRPKFAGDMFRNSDDDRVSYVDNSIDVKQLAYTDDLLGRMFSTVTSAGAVNTIVETSIIGSLAPGASATIPMNTATVGESYEIVQTGSITIDTGTTPTLIFRVKLNSTTIVAMPAIVVPDIAGSLLYTLKINSMTFLAVGVSGTIRVNGTLEFLSINDVATSVKIGMHQNIPITLDTTIDNILDVTAQWGTAAATNALISESTTMKRIY